jgi:hypothetical protein
MMSNASQGARGRPQDKIDPLSRHYTQCLISNFGPIYIKCDIFLKTRQEEMAEAGRHFSAPGALRAAALGNRKGAASIANNMPVILCYFSY